MLVTNLTLWVQDNETSERFYKSLGFRLKFKDEAHSRLEDERGFEIVLVSMRDEAEFAGDSMDPAKGKGVYIYIKSDNVDSEFERLQGLGFDTVKPPRGWPWGNREFVVKDPDGYKLCFWQKV